MNKNITQSIKVLILSLVLVAGVGFAWSGPTQSPAGGNIPAPINISSVAQYKTGGLAIGSTSLPSSVSSGSAKLYVAGLSLMKQLLVQANALVANKLTVGLVNSSTESLEASNLLLSTKLTPCLFAFSTGMNPSASHYPAPLCAKSDGTIYVCDQTGAGCTGVIPGSGSTLGN